MNPETRQRKETERPAVKERGQVKSLVREKARDLAGSADERNSRERTGSPRARRRPG